MSELRTNTVMRLEDSKEENSTDDGPKNIFSSGKCQRCDSNATNQTVSCLFCRNRFHVINCFSDQAVNSFPSTTFDTVIAPALGLRGSATWEKRPGNLAFVCDPCMEHFECNKQNELDNKTGHRSHDATAINIESNGQQHINNIINDTLSSFKRDILEAIDEKLSAALTNNDVSNYTKSPQPLFTDIVSNNPINIVNNSSFSNQSQLQPKDTEREVLVLSPSEPNDGNKTSTDFVSKVKKTVTNTMKNVQVSKIQVNNTSGKISVTFPNSAARDAGLKSLEEKGNLNTLGYSAKNANKLLPKITLNGVNSDILDDIDTTGKNIDEIRDLQKVVIIDQLNEKNPCIKTLSELGHTVQVVFVRKFASAPKLTIGIKISAAIRTALLHTQNGSVFLGPQSYRFEDRFHYIQCYHCQLLGHTSVKGCPKKDDQPVCLYCMQGHKSSECKLKNQPNKHCCAKCLASTNPDDNANYRTHNSASNDCPVIIREIRRLIDMTDMVSKNVM